ncbi:MAG: TlyA family RNA methyltransferase [Dehalococcoidales bacterium]|nr:MAG: TlyA family RNA methyltransferase [Dehalococcoidales bacterium]
MTKRRIDSLLVDRGLAESRARAQALIMAGEVAVDGKIVNKAGTMVAEDLAITVKQSPPYVGRGGLKLDYALERFQIDVTSRVAVDVGASTGGFTDCLLQRGADRVYAVDVGSGQLDYRLRKDPRVVVMERINARYPITLPENVDFITIDVSFISVQKIIPSVEPLLKATGDLVVLIKPQFEARRQEVGKGGVIKKPLVHARVLGRFIIWMTEHDLRLAGLVASPILGASGNREFFVWLKLT